MFKQTLFLGLATLGVMSPSSFAKITKAQCTSFVSQSKKVATQKDANNVSNLCDCVSGKAKSTSDADMTAAIEACKTKASLSWYDPRKYL
jgi:hypothetical protein